MISTWPGMIDSRARASGSSLGKFVQYTWAKDYTLTSNKPNYYYIKFKSIEWSKSSTNNCIGFSNFTFDEWCILHGRNLINMLSAMSVQWQMEHDAKCAFVKRIPIFEVHYLQKDCRIAEAQQRCSGSNIVDSICSTDKTENIELLLLMLMLCANSNI